MDSSGYNYIKVSDGDYEKTRIAIGIPHGLMETGIISLLLLTGIQIKLDVYLDGDLHNGGGQGNLAGLGSITPQHSLDYTEEQMEDMMNLLFQQLSVMQVGLKPAIIIKMIHRVFTQFYPKNLFHQQQ